MREREKKECCASYVHSIMLARWVVANEALEPTYIAQR